MDVHLVVVKGNPRGRTLTFGPGEYLFGRGQECHVRPDSEWVSRQHCLLAISGDVITLKDLGSTNGTLVNGSRVIGVRDLVHGDTVQIGPLVLQVRLPEIEEQLEAFKQTDPQVGDVTLADQPSEESHHEPLPQPQEPQLDTVKLPSRRKSESKSE